MSSEKEFEKDTNILPFQQRKEEKFKSSAMLVAIDLQSNALGLSEDALTKLLEDKLDASILHVEYLDVDLPMPKDEIIPPSANDNSPKLQTDI